PLSDPNSYFFILYKRSERALEQVLSGEQNQDAPLRWLFEKRSPTAVANVPKSKEYFQSDSLEAIVLSLAKEGTQNAQDAKDILRFGPVTLRFSRMTYPGEMFWKELMNGMEEHIDAIREKARSV